MGTPLRKSDTESIGSGASDAQRQKKNLHILLVEDNRYDAMMLMDFFSQQANPPKVHWVTDGYEALDYFLHINNQPVSNHPDIVLLDIGLPRISGYDVLDKLKKHPSHADIPILVLTTSRSRLDHTQCRKLGCNGTISKPSNLKGYVEMVDKMINVDFPALMRDKKKVLPPDHSILQS